MIAFVFSFFFIIKKKEKRERWHFCILDWRTKQSKNIFLNKEAVLLIIDDDIYVAFIYNWYECIFL